MRRIVNLGLVLAALCLVVPAVSFAGAGGTHPNGNGNGNKGGATKKVHNIGYVFKGTVVSTTPATDYAPGQVVVHVLKVNHHGRTLRGTDVTFLLDAKTKIHKHGKRGAGLLEDLVAGDGVQIKSMAPRNPAADYQFTARWILDKTRAPRH